MWSSVNRVPRIRPAGFIHNYFPSNMRILKFNPIGFFLGRTNNPIIRNDIENVFGGASSHALNVGERTSGAWLVSAVSVTSVFLWWGASASCSSWPGFGCGCCLFGGFGCFLASLSQSAAAGGHVPGGGTGDGVCAGSEY